MAQNITLLGASYSDVPAVTLPKTGGGTASFTDVTDTTAAAADVAAGKYFYTASGVRTLGTGSGGGTGGITQDQDGYLVLSPDGGGGGGGGFTLLYSSEVQASTTSTSATSLETFQTGATFEAGKTYMVSIRDKAGKRNGYFYGTDTYFFIPGSFASDTLSSSVCIGINSDGTYNRGSSGRGVYLYRYYGGSSTMGDINIYERYDDTRGTVDGTYTVKLFEVTLPT